jgi:hypothetical protein
MMILTNEEVDAAFKQPNEDGFGKSRYDIAHAIEAKILEKIGKPVGYFYYDHEGTLREAHDLQFKEAHQPLYKLPEVKE